MRIKNTFSIFGLVALAAALILGAAAGASAFTEPDMSTYTSYPVFLSSSVTPNIMVILDNSGSMNECAYGNHGYWVTDDSYVCGGWDGTPSSNRDMAEETDGAAEPGKTAVNSGDIDLGRINRPNMPNVTSGIRFQDVPIPQGATITSATISFVANTSMSDPTEVRIFGHDVVNSWQFTDEGWSEPYSAGNPWNYDISSRIRTTSFADWDIPAWTAGASGADYTTPDLTAIVQEMVDQPGWDQGNAMTFIFTNLNPGQGQREAEQTTGDDAPVLHIEFDEDCERYYGYFNPDSQYSYDGSKFVPDPSGDWNGNWLNWVTMRKVDVARKVMVGGWADSRDGDGEVILKGETNDHGRDYRKWFTCDNCIETPWDGTYYYKVSGGDIIIYDEDINWQAEYNIRVVKTEDDEPQDFVEGDPAGVLQRVGDRARWGYMYFYNGSYDGAHGGPVEQPVGSDLGIIVDDIEDKDANSWTPLAETYYVATHYFKQEQVDLGLGYSSNAVGPLNADNDPYIHNDKTVECAKSFALLITDGASTKDGMIPTDLQDYDGDGNDGCSGDCDSDFLDDVALYAHTQDLRDDLPGKQTLTLYPIYAFGDNNRARELLKDAAKNGGFTDKDGDDRPNLQEEWDEDGDYQPDTYFEASSGYEMESQLLAAITDILKRASSGTAVSVLATSNEGEGTLVQAYFKPSVTTQIGLETQDVNWVGYLHSLWVDQFGRTREDTAPADRNLDVTYDQIVDFFFDTQTNQASFHRFEVDDEGNPVYSDSNNNGEWDPGEPFSYTTHTLDELSPLWEAGEQLNARDPVDRNMYTWVDSNNDGIVDDGEFLQLDAANESAIKPYLGVGDDTVWSYLGENIDARARNLINFTRGQGDGFETTTDMRFRDINGATWKLGDIVHSTPVTVGRPLDAYHVVYGDRSYFYYYSDKMWRPQTVYVGSNSGMLHNFYMGYYNAFTNWEGEREVYFSSGGPGFGEERWTYVPQALLPHLKWLADPDYTHVYYVDLKPRIFDAKVFPDTWPHTGGWGTILVGGLNYGGKDIQVNEDFGTGSNEVRSFAPVLYALDITDPDNPQLLWEKSYADMGLTINSPTVAKVGDQWMLVASSGPTNFEGSTSNKGQMYVIDLATGDLMGSFQAAEKDSFMTAPVVMDVDLASTPGASDYSTELGYVGVPYQKSNGDWAGKLYRFEMNGSSNPGSWSFEPAADLAGPPTAAPGVAMDEARNIWVYLGTGRYFSEADKLDTSTQYFYGIRADSMDSGNIVNNTSGSVNLLDTTGVDVYTDGTVTGVSGIGTWDELVAEIYNHDGWRYTLGTGANEAGERVLNKPIVIGGLVLDTTFTPNQDPCGFSGNSAIYGFYYKTGTAYYEEVFVGGSEEVDVGGETKTKVGEKVDIGVGKASGVSVHVGSQSGATGFVQQSTGIVESMDLQTAGGLKSGFIYWRER